jgi:hypothetical protein
VFGNTPHIAFFVTLYALLRLVGFHLAAMTNAACQASTAYEFVTRSLAPPPLPGMHGMLIIINQSAYNM